MCAVSEFMNGLMPSRKAKLSSSVPGGRRSPFPPRFIQFMCSVLSSAQLSLGLSIRLSPQPSPPVCLSVSNPYSMLYLTISILFIHHHPTPIASSILSNTNPFLHYPTCFLQPALSIHLSLHNVTSSRSYVSFTQPSNPAGQPSNVLYRHPIPP